MLALASICSSVAVADTRVSTSILSDASAISRGDAFRVGILFKIPDHAHIYWHNPGDSGLPTAIEWAAPEGFVVEELQWPNPTAFDDAILNETTFGYETEVLLFAKVRAPYTIDPGETVTISANAEWLICLEDGQCIPERALHELPLPVAEDLNPSPDAPIFDAYAACAPGTIRQSGLPAKITVTGQPNPRVTVILDKPWRINLAGPTPRFFPDRGSNWLMTDDSEGFEDAAEVTFVPTGKVEGYTSGALTLPVVNTETDETRSTYLRFGKRPED